MIELNWRCFGASGSVFAKTVVNAARDALNRLPPGNEDDERARLRADAVFAGVVGRGERAISDAERYKQLGGTDGWGDVAYAEWVLSTKNAPPDSVEKAVRQMSDLMARDSTFIRPYVLAGRLLLAASDNFIVRLRRYIETDPASPRHLLTVRGVGYRFVSDPDRR